MTNVSKRPRGRPRIHPPGTTGADRKRLSRLGTGTVQVEVSHDVALALDALALQHGDTSRGVVIARLLLGASGGA